MAQVFSEKFWTWESTNMSLGTLASRTSTLINLQPDAARLQGCKVDKVKERVIWVGKTTGEGPLLFGLSWGNSTGEINAAISGDPQGDEEIRMEEVKRNIFPLGFIDAISVTSESTTPSNTTKFNEHRLPSWIIRRGNGLQFFVFNFSNITLITGCIVTPLIGLRQAWMGE